MPNASDLAASGWERIFIGKTKHGGMIHIWRHPEREGDFTYQQAMSEMLRARREADCEKE